MMAGWQVGYAERNLQAGVMGVYEKMVGGCCAIVMSVMDFFNFFGSSKCWGWADVLSVLSEIGEMSWW